MSSSTSARARANVGASLAFLGATLAVVGPASAQEVPPAELGPVASVPSVPSEPTDRLERRAIPELYVSGAVLFGSAWVATIGLTAGLTPGAQVGRATAFATIPVVGPWVMLGSNVTNQAYTGALVTSGVAQAAGLGLLITGLVARREVHVPTLTTAHARVSFVPTPGGAAAIGVF